MSATPLVGISGGVNKFLEMCYLILFVTQGPMQYFRENSFWEKSYNSREKKIEKKKKQFIVTTMLCLHFAWTNIGMVPYLQIVSHRFLIFFL